MIAWAISVPTTGSNELLMILGERTELGLELLTSRLVEDAEATDAPVLRLSFRPNKPVAPGGGESSEGWL
jgi:hypothetical protein